MVMKSLVMCSLVFMLLFGVSIVSAGDFSVKVHTLNNYNVDIFVLEPIETWQRIDSAFGNSGSAGVVEKAFSVNPGIAHIYVNVKDGNDIVNRTRVDSHLTTQPLELYILVDAPVEEVVNDTVVNDTAINDTVVNDTIADVVEADDTAVVEENVPNIREDGNGFTGMAIFDWENTSSKIFYGVLGVVVLGFVSFLFMKKGSSKRASGEEPRVAKLSEMSKQASGERLDAAERKLENAEKELREAHTEISNIKNRKSELSDAEKAFEAAKANLDKLKGDGD
jgi:hypothetical protein